MIISANIVTQLLRINSNLIPSADGFIGGSSWLLIYYFLNFVKKKTKKIHENVFVSGVRSSGPAVLRPL